jgi:hypothetical protein
MLVVHFHQKVEYKWFHPEPVHETGSPGYFAAESDGAVEPVNAFLILKNTIPERLRAGRVVAGVVWFGHPGNHLRLPGSLIRLLFLLKKFLDLSTCCGLFARFLLHQFQSNHAL